MKRLRYAVYRYELGKLAAKPLSRHATREEAEASMRDWLLSGVADRAVLTLDGHPVRSMTVAEASAATVRFNVEVIETYEVEFFLPDGMSADPADWTEGDKLRLHDLIEDAMADMPAFDGVTHRYPLDADGNPGEEI